MTLALGYDCGINLLKRPVRLTALDTCSVALWGFDCNGTVNVCFPFSSAAGVCHSLLDCYSSFKSTQHSSFSRIALQKV